MRDLQLNSYEIAHAIGVPYDKINKVLLELGLLKADAPSWECVDNKYSLAEVLRLLNNKNSQKLIEDSPTSMQSVHSEMHTLEDLMSVDDLASYYGIKRRAMYDRLLDLGIEPESFKINPGARPTPLYSREFVHCEMHKQEDLKHLNALSADMQQTIKEAFVKGRMYDELNKLTNEQKDQLLIEYQEQLLIGDIITEKAIHDKESALKHKEESLDRLCDTIKMSNIDHDIMERHHINWRREEEKELDKWRKWLEDNK